MTIMGQKDEGNEPLLQLALTRILCLACLMMGNQAKSQVFIGALKKS